MPAPASHDAYLAGQSPAQAALLTAFRARLAALLPEADEVISYAMPGFRQGGKVVAGYPGWVKHCSFYPHSGNVVPQFEGELAALGLGFTKSAVHFTADRPIPEDLLRLMIAARRAEIATK